MIRSSSRRLTGLALALCSMLAAASLATTAPALAETCPNEEFRTGAGAELPDCRGYELVTPPFKEAVEAGINSNFATVGFDGGISANGSHVDVASLGNFGDAKSGAFANTYELTRSESGWTETNIDLPASQFPASLPIATTPEFESVLYEARTTEQSVYAKDFWLREADGALRDIGPFEPPADTEGPPSREEGRINYLGGEFVEASNDLSHILFESEVPWPGDEANGSLYEYTVGVSGPPVPVGVEPDGNPCAASVPASVANGDPLVNDFISVEGKDVFFRCSGQLFARIEEARTVALSEPSVADCPACDTKAVATSGPSFDGTTPDGSKVFFTTTQPLLGSEKETSANIYEYDFDPGAGEERVTRVTAGDWGPGGAQVQGTGAENGTVVRGVKVSEDGSHVYFTADGALGGVSNSQGQLPIEGRPNLYVYERDSQFPEGRISFIATEGQLGQVTPNGEFMVFESSVDLTPGDTSTVTQIFEYDAQAGDLVRCSIGQNGYNDNGNSDIFGALLPLSQVGRRNRPVAVSDNGAYVVFQSVDGLTPGALNGYRGEVENIPYYANNVYEYHAGTVDLISDGQDTSEKGGGSSVAVEGMSHSGDDIFFTTADQLVPQDLDTQIDLYDARVDGGFPAPVSLLPTCAGDACQGQLSGAPVLLSPGSEFQAGGNPPLAEAAPAAKPKSKPKAKAKAKRCRKGNVKKRGKCDKTARSKKAKAKKASNGRRSGS